MAIVNVRYPDVRQAARAHEKMQTSDVVLMVVDNSRNYRCQDGPKLSG